MCIRDRAGRAGPQPGDLRRARRGPRGRPRGDGLTVRRAARGRWATGLLLAPPLAFLTLLFALPLLRVLWGSVFAPDFTLAHYVRMWTVPVYGRVFWLSLIHISEPTRLLSI